VQGRRGSDSNTTQYSTNTLGMNRASYTSFVDVDKQVNVLNKVHTV
jgi:hypothetical protein